MKKRNMPLKVVPQNIVIQSGKNNHDEAFVNDPVIFSVPVGYYRHFLIELESNKCVDNNTGTD
jgi:hypothetical protein